MPAWVIVLLRFWKISFLFRNSKSKKNFNLKWWKPHKMLFLTSNERSCFLFFVDGIQIKWCISILESACIWDVLYDKGNLVFTMCLILDASTYIVFNGILQLIIHTKEKNAIMFTHPPAVSCTWILVEILDLYEGNLHKASLYEIACSSLYLRASLRF